MADRGKGVSGRRVFFLFARAPRFQCFTQNTPSRTKTQDVAALSPLRDFVLTNKFGNAIDVGDLDVR